MKHFEAAKEEVVVCEHSDPVTAIDSTFNGYSNDDALASACMAVVCFAFCVEATVNYVWNEIAGPKYPNDRSRKTALRTYKVLEKVNDISELYDGPQVKDLSSLDRKTITRLFDLRNRFAHFKEMVEFQPFSSASEVELLLAWDEMIKFHAASKQIILSLSRHSSLDTIFLSGIYETVTVEG